MQMKEKQNVNIVVVAFSSFIISIVDSTVKVETNANERKAKRKYCGCCFQ